MALRHDGGGTVLMECWCHSSSSKVVWAKLKQDGVMVVDSDKGSVEAEDEYNFHKFDISGFALCLAGLAPTKTKKRAKVVNRAFNWAHAARGKAHHAHVVDHAWSLLAMYVTPCGAAFAWVVM